MLMGLLTYARVNECLFCVAMNLEYGIITSYQKYTLLEKVIEFISFMMLNLIFVMKRGIYSFVSVYCSNLKSIYAHSEA